MQKCVVLNFQCCVFGIIELSVHRRDSRLITGGCCRLFVFHPNTARPPLHAWPRNTSGLTRLVMFCQGITALCVAAGTGSLPIVSALVGGGADVNGSSIGDAAVTSLPSQDELRSSLESWHAMAVTPLQAAAANGHTPVMQYLCTKVCGRSFPSCVCACHSTCLPLRARTCVVPPPSTLASLLSTSPAWLDERTPLCFSSSSVPPLVQLQHQRQPC